MGKRSGFPRSARLTAAAEFRRVFEQCRCKSSDRWMTVLAVTNRLGRPRLGMAISRKAAKLAVDRNRIKRIVREQFRNHQHHLGPWDLVVIARAGIADQSDGALHQALANHWKRLQRTCDDC